MRLFPLPNLVLFPHVMQPLHIFERRYRLLLEDALEDDRLVAMAILAPGWEEDYEGRPALSPIACLSRIVTHHRLEDGTYTALVLGLCRVELIRELEPVREFREAEIERCKDYCPPEQAFRDETFRHELCQAFREAAPMLPEAWDQLDQLMGGNTPLGILTDVISYTLDIGMRVKEALLAEANTHRRAEMLLEQLSTAGSEDAPGNSTMEWFPPESSVN